MTLNTADVLDTDKTPGKATEGEESADSEKRVVESSQQPDASTGESSDHPVTEPEGEPSKEQGSRPETTSEVKGTTDQLASSGSKVRQFNLPTVNWQVIIRVSCPQVI